MLEEENKLIEEAKQGSAKHFERLYDHYVAPIYRFIYMKVSHREEAEDLTHEVFVSAWQNIKGYKLKGFPFSSWLYQIARNRVIDYYRLQRPQISLDYMDPETQLLRSQPYVDLEAAIDQSLSLEKIRAAIRQLNDDQGSVLIMRFMENLSHHEIAAALKKSEGAVRLIQHRAINQLKRILGDGGKDS